MRLFASVACVAGAEEKPVRAGSHLLWLEEHAQHTA